METCVIPCVVPGHHYVSKALVLHYFLSAKNEPPSEVIRFTVVEEDLGHRRCSGGACFFGVSWFVESRGWIFNDGAVGMSAVLIIVSID